MRIKGVNLKMFCYISFIVAVCPELFIANGTVTHSNNRRINGTVATYACDGDLVLVGNAERTCTCEFYSEGETVGGKSVEWDGSDPSCRKFTKLL